MKLTPKQEYDLMLSRYAYNKLSIGVHTEVLNRDPDRCELVPTNNPTIPFNQYVQGVVESHEAECKKYEQWFKLKDYWDETPTFTKEGVLKEKGGKK